MINKLLLLSFLLCSCTSGQLDNYKKESNAIIIKKDSIFIDSIRIPTH